VTDHTTWPLVEPDIQTALDRFESPLDELAAGRIPALVIRNAWSAESCSQLVDRLVLEELLYDRSKPIPEKFQKKSIPEGYYREGTNSSATLAWKSPEAVGKNRIDIGSSLGYRGSDKEAFLAHSEETHALFDRLFDDGNDPIKLMYSSLEALSRDKTVVTAHEPDGRKYGRPSFEPTTADTRTLRISTRFDFGKSGANTPCMTSSTSLRECSCCRTHSSAT